MSNKNKDIKRGLRFADEKTIEIVAVSRGEATYEGKDIYKHSNEFRKEISK